MGEKRSRQERAIREQRMQKKQSRIGISEAAVRAGAAEQEKSREERKAFRIETLRRRREMEADKRKKEEEEKKKQELEKIRAAEQKKKDLYMKDIRDTATAKGAILQQLNTLKAEYATDRQHVEFDHRTALETAQRKHMQRCLEIEREAHERKNSIESELKTKLYQLEAGRRMQLQAESNKTQHELSALRSMRDLNEAERKAEDIRKDAYRMQRKIEGEWKDKKTAQEQEILWKRTEANDAAKDAKMQADGDLRTAISTADNALKHRLEELTTAFKNHIRPLRVR